MSTRLKPCLLLKVEWGKPGEVTQPRLCVAQSNVALKIHSPDGMVTTMGTNIHQHSE